MKICTMSIGNTLRWLSNFSKRYGHKNVFQIKRHYSAYNPSDHIELFELSRHRNNAVNCVNVQTIEIHRPSRKIYKGMHLGINHPTAWIKENDREYIITKESFNHHSEDISNELLFVFIILTYQELVIRNKNMKKYKPNKSHSKAYTYTFFRFYEMIKIAKERSLW